MYLESQLLQLQHAIVLRALDDIKTPALRLKYYREVRSSLETFAQLYHMTADEMIQSAIASGYIEPFTEREVEEYGK
jgi:hypothetical protein